MVDRTRYLYRFLLSGSYDQWISSPKDQMNLHPFQRLSAIAQQMRLGELQAPSMLAMAEPIEIPEAPYVIIVAGSSNAHSGQKRWPLENFKELCDRLLNKNITPVLIGTSSDDLGGLECALKQTKVVNLIGKTSLYQLITLAKGAKYAIGNDTGPILVAAASECPTVTLYSGANPPDKGGAWIYDKQKHVSIFDESLKAVSVEKVINHLA
jgi:ADP-heptose:LPS heptosyltransferase